MGAVPFVHFNQGFLWIHISCAVHGDKSSSLIPSSFQNLSCKLQKETEDAFVYVHIELLCRLRLWRCRSYSMDGQKIQGNLNRPLIHTCL